QPGTFGMRIAADVLEARSEIPAAHVLLAIVRGPLVGPTPELDRTRLSAPSARRGSEHDVPVVERLPLIARACHLPPVADHMDETQPRYHRIQPGKQEVRSEERRVGKECRYW